MSVGPRPLRRAPRAAVVVVYAQHTGPVRPGDQRTHAKQGGWSPSKQSGDQPSYKLVGKLVKRHMWISLFMPFPDLPPDGETLTRKEDVCDEFTMLCKTKLHVYETHCRRCYGTGTMRTATPRGHRLLATCPCCQGMGFVRYSTRFGPPPILGEEGPDYTLNRPAPDPEEKKKRAAAKLNPLGLL